MHKVITIMQKEWADVFRNRTVLFSTLLMPLMFAAIPLVFVVSARGMDAGNLPAEFATQMPSVCPEGLSAIDCLQLLVLNQFMLMFMFTPLIVPINLAAYSIVGEKASRSLEPLLATPITTIELLVGKNLSAALPAIAGTWLSFGVYTLGSALLVGNPAVVGLLVRSVSWLAAILLGPLLSVLSVNVCLMVSSRVNEPHAAEQISSMVILPLLLVFLGQMAGLVVVSRRLVLLAGAALVVVDSVLLYLAVRLFERETILTRWR
jgi:ABC-2 type transport system permease protein